MYKHFRETVSKLKNLAKSNSCRYNMEKKKKFKKNKKKYDEKIIIQKFY